MKKHDEGYALPFVLVVSIVMCLIAVTVMSFSLDSLKAQQNSIQRTQAKYDAVGVFEKILAAVEDEKEDTIQSENIEVSVPYEDKKVVRIKITGYAPNGEAKIILVTEIELLDEITNGSETITVADFASVDGEYTTIKYNGKVKIVSYTYEQVSKSEKEG